MLRSVHEHELPVLRRWRNHPKVRASSFTTHEISPAEHARWWARVRDDPARRVFVYEHEGEAAGVVSYSGLDAGTRTASWAFYLDLDGLERSGALLAAWIGLERAAIAHAFGPLGLTRLRGEVLASNEPVRRLHRRFGFAEVAVHGLEVEGLRRDVIAIELTREDHA
ncbi:UDP-4-amino-4,6-dideoxy-N-acetyl-beta-L-altrosamine N-acetyltransferase [Nonomuraea sp. SBT364]|uniref:UDP-4-amino-4, 6-dideoxy-N-acetyl-beta-L-altrosamine N-acetyltransferase n=1 Tax=Nonomuraea sp. SBT364 TaxID=1580530 RepID=UPI00066E349A|nr:UDP-4-amino-4,6-dideoxy-N-acetyl-beta-L-altrosamine N-acetyltransferase [Nonomuraea sp. SBT364]